MNLFVSLKRTTYSRSDLPGQLFDQAKPLILEIRNLPISIPEQDQLIQTLIDHLNADEEHPQAELERARKQIAELKQVHKKDEWKNVMDFFLFAPLWIVLYQVVLCTLVEGKTEMGMGWGSLIQVIGLYLLVRWVEEAAIRYPYGWKRWLMVLAFFAGALLLTWLCDRIPGVLQVSVIPVLVICIIVFAAAYIWHRSFYESRPNPLRP